MIALAFVAGVASGVALLAVCLVWAPRSAGGAS